MASKKTEAEKILDKCSPLLDNLKYDNINRPIKNTRQYPRKQILRAMEEYGNLKVAKAIGKLNEDNAIVRNNGNVLGSIEIQLKP